MPGTGALRQWPKRRSRRCAREEPRAPGPGSPRKDPGSTEGGTSRSDGTRTTAIDILVSLSRSASGRVPRVSSPYDQAPRVFRPMKAASGQPIVGSGRAELGARVPSSSSTPDVTPDGTGQVHPGGGGMSVSPTLRQVPPFLLPRRLKTQLGLREAKAPDDWQVFRLGSGLFQAGAVGPDLILRPDRDDHGVIEPARVVSVPDYQACLASTKDAWTVDET